jgi:hypothetical protein
VAAVKIILGGCCALSAFFFILSYQWGQSNPASFVPNPYTGPAEAYGILAVLLSFVSIIARKIFEMPMKKRRTTIILVAIIVSILAFFLLPVVPNPPPFRICSLAACQNEVEYTSLSYAALCQGVVFDWPPQPYYSLFPPLWQECLTEL